MQRACPVHQISFSKNVTSLKHYFVKFKYPDKLINQSMHNFQLPPDLSQPLSDCPSDSPLWITIPFKDKKSADVVPRWLCNRGRKINHDPQSIFLNKKIIDDLRVTELKPVLVNQHNVVCQVCRQGFFCRRVQSSEEMRRWMKRAPEVWASKGTGVHAP